MWALLKKEIFVDINSTTQSQGLQDIVQPNGGTQQGTYNGDVKVRGNTVHVVNGVTQYKGMTFYLSANGGMVIDDKFRLHGFIENGEFKETTQEHLAKLKALGLIEGGR